MHQQNLQNKMNKLQKTGKFLIAYRSLFVFLYRVWNQNEKVIIFCFISAYYENKVEKICCLFAFLEVVNVDLALELEEARNQWHNAQSVYNEVSDPALIDAVIYQVMAAERRYEYLLRLAKCESLTCENIPVR